jgi:hypothetical protein
MASLALLRVLTLCGLDEGISTRQKIPDHLPDGNLDQGRTITMTRRSKGDLVMVGFNYQLLDTKVAGEVRTIADRIRDRVKKTLQDVG